MAQLMDVEEIYQRGFELRCEGRYSEAKNEFGRVLAIQPNHANARWQLGIILGFEGDFDGSLAALQSLVRENPRHSEGLYDLAMTEMMLGMIDEARQHFLELLEMNPGHEGAKKQLAYF